MNKTIVREHYPASMLPEDLRPPEDPHGHVTVTVEVERREPEHVMSLDEIWLLRRPPFRTKSDIDAEIRQQRDEWDG